MEKLTLEEAIKHAKEVAKTNRAEATYNFPELKEYYDNCSECANQHNQLAEWLEELKSFKEAEEQGLLVRLPCNVGDTVYKLWYYDGKPYKIQQHVTRTLSEICGLIESKNLGKTVFLTREEAEKKLEEMKSAQTSMD